MKRGWGDGWRVLGTLCLLLLLPGVAGGADVHAAVASNFVAVMKEITARFEAEQGDRVVVVPGATGRHYAQIVNGAPFALFLAADVERPQRLEQEGVAQPGSRFTYALGRLVLWSSDPALVDEAGAVLRQEERFDHLALANPRLAPYGRAAAEVMARLGVSSPLRSRLVRGENISQTLQFVQSGNADLGFVAASQLPQSQAEPMGSHWEVPASLHEPIEQQAVLLQDDPVARRFLDYLRSEPIQALIRSRGYATP